METCLSQVINKINFQLKMHFLTNNSLSIFAQVLVLEEPFEPNVETGHQSVS